MAEKKPTFSYGCPRCGEVFAVTLDETTDFHEVRSSHGTHLRLRTVVPRHGSCPGSKAEHTVTANRAAIVVLNEVMTAKRAEANADR